MAGGAATFDGPAARCGAGMNEESFRDPSTGNQAATIGSLLSSRGRLLRAVARGAAFGFAAAGTLARAAFAPAGALPGGGAMGAGLTFFPAGSTPFFAEAAAFPEGFAALAGFGVFDGFEAFAGFEAFDRAVFADFAREAALATFPFFAGCRPAFPETFLRTGA
ncbi:MAG TPA: hypothetical protein VM557_13180 [Thermoanaerobaculia bacterium]|nr:hypothetical protein [Thermoanaerobaculia bacterium]